jgi:flagellar biosynthesis protein FliP
MAIVCVLSTIALKLLAIFYLNRFAMTLYLLRNRFDNAKRSPRNRIPIALLPFEKTYVILPFALVIYQMRLTPNFAHTLAHIQNASKRQGAEEGRRSDRGIRTELLACE